MTGHMPVAVPWPPSKPISMRARHGRGGEDGHQDQHREQQTDHVLTGTEGHAQGQLWAHQFGRALGGGKVLAQEHGGEDDADEQPGQHAPGLDHPLGEQAVLAPRPVEAAQHLWAQEQEDRTADDGARQEQGLDSAHLDAHELPREQGDSED